MQNSALKLSALAGVVGIGFLVVLQTQRGLFQQTKTTPQSVLENFTDEDETNLLTADDLGSSIPMLGEPEADIFSIQSEPTSEVTTAAANFGSDASDVRPSSSTPTANEPAPVENSLFESTTADNQPAATNADSKLSNSSGLDFREKIGDPLAERENPPAVINAAGNITSDKEENPFGTASERSLETDTGGVITVAAEEATTSDAKKPADTEKPVAASNAVVFDPFAESAVPEQETARSKTNPISGEPRRIDLNKKDPRPLLIPNSQNADRDKDTKPSITQAIGEKQPQTKSSPTLPAKFEPVEPAESPFSSKPSVKSSDDDPFGASSSSASTNDEPKRNSVPVEQSSANPGQPSPASKSNPFAKQPEPALFPADVPTTSSIKPVEKTEGLPKKENPFPRETPPQVKSDPVPDKSNPFDPFKRDSLDSSKKSPPVPSRKEQLRELPSIESFLTTDPPTSENRPAISKDASPASQTGPALGNPSVTSAPPEAEKPSITTAPFEAKGPIEISRDGTVSQAQPAGTQKPELTIEKQAPQNAFLGRPLIYSILIKNVGTTAARQVVVEDRIPKGSKLTGTIPQAELSGKRLIWRIGTLQPDEQKKISIRVIPTSEGEIGSIATVNFVAEIAAKTTMTTPKLELALVAPPLAKVGEPVLFQFKVQNNGSVDAKDVWIRNLIPEQLVHPGGADLEYEIGVLPAGKSREIELTMTATKAGLAVNRATVSASGEILAQAKSELQIASTSISLSRTGPKKRFVGRSAEFTNVVTNESKSPVAGITIIEIVPPGMEFVKASTGGQYNVAKQTVAWRVERLGPGEKASFKVTYRTRKIGKQTSIVKVRSQNKSLAEISSITDVVGITLLAIDVTDIDGAAAVGEQFSVRLRLRNRGTKTATNVSARLILPPELKLVSAQGPVKYTKQADGIQFESIAKIASKREAIIDVELVGKKVGDFRLEVQLNSDELSRPLSREEAIVIFDDSQ